MLSLLDPPSDMTVDECAQKFRVLQNDGGGYSGAWRNALAPYTVAPMRSCTDPRYEFTIFCGPAQSAKTEIGLNWMTYTAIVDPADLQIVLPEKSLIDDFSVRRIQRAIAASPDLKEAFDSGDRVDRRDMFDFGRSLVNLSWPTSSQAASKPVPRNWLDESDSMPDSVGATNDKPGEGDAIDLYHKRSQTFGSRRHTLVTSSPKRNPIKNAPKPVGEHEMPVAHGITARFNSGTRKFLYWQCKDEMCRKWFVTRFRDLVYDDMADPDQADLDVSFACPHCGERHVEEDRMSLLLGAQWIGEGQRIDEHGSVSGNLRQTIIDSYWLFGPQAAFVTLVELVRKFLRAKHYERTQGSDTLLRAFMNVDAGELYVPELDGEEEQVTADMVKKAATDLPLGVVPAWTKLLVAAVDVQGSRFELQWQAVGADGSFAIIDHQRLMGVTANGKPLLMGGSSTVVAGIQVLPVDPAQRLEHWLTLIEAVFERALPIEGRENAYMLPMLVAIDTGGPSGASEKAYRFSRWLRQKRPELHSRAMFIKGNKGRNPVRVMRSQWDPRTSRTRINIDRRDVDLWIIFTDEVKDSVHSMLKGLCKAHGSKALDEGRKVDSVLQVSKYLETYVFEQLCVEEKVNNTWENTRRVPNEAWDLAVYCRAATIRLGVDRVDWEDPRVKERCASTIRIINHGQSVTPQDPVVLRPDNTHRRSVRGGVQI